MAIKHMHDDYKSNKRKRLLIQGSLEDRLALVERILFAIVDEKMLSASDQDQIKKIKNAEKDYPD